MTTYNVGPGQTYETWTAFHAAITVQPNDIVLGGDNTFTDRCIVNGSGTSGNEINYKNYTVDGGGALIRLVNLAQDYITVDGVTAQNGIDQGFRLVGDYNFLNNCIANDNGAVGVLIIGTNNSINNLTSTSSAGVIALVQIEATGLNTTISNSSLISDKDCIEAATSFTVSNTSTTSHDANGFLLQNITTGTSVLTNISADSCGTNGFFSSNSDSEIQINGATLSRNEAYGVSFLNSALTGSSYLKNFSIQNSGSHGVILTDSSDIEISSGTIENSTDDGIRVTGSSSSGVLIQDVSLVGNLLDGIDVSDNATNVTIKRTVVEESGISTIPSSGDAITGHVGNTGITAAFNLTMDNLNTSLAMVNDSSGFFYHHTSVNDGDNDDFTSRATMYLNSTGAWTVKNSIFYNNLGYKMGWVGLTPLVTLDYNAYISTISPTGACFSQNGVDKTWAEWIAIVGNETNSIYIHEDSGSWKVYLGSDPGTLAQTLSYNPVTNNGKLVAASDNPLLDSGLVIAGVNDGGELDIWGNATDSTPNIGTYQGKGEGGVAGYGRSKFGASRYGTGPWSGSRW